MAALTVALGLVGGNSAMLATTVFAASPFAPNGSQGLGLGLLTLVSGSGASDGPQITLPQAACQTVPALCQPGTRVFEIPSGVVTLGAPSPRAPGHTRGHVVLPGTGCLLGRIGCGGQSTPTPRVGPAVTAMPAISTTISSPAPSSTSAPAGSCLLAILTGCPSGGTGVTNTCTAAASGGGCTATPAPTPSGDGALCVLLCNVLSIGGTSCVATVLTTCVVPTAPTAPPAPGSSSPSAGACVGTLLCLLGSSCTASVGTQCLLGAVLPGLPGGNPGSTQPPTPGSGTGPGTAPGSGAVQPGTTTPAGTGGGAGFVSTFPAASSQGAGGGAGGSGINTSQQPRRDETVGLVSGLSFGHGLILWPLFGLLDLAALAGLVVVVRRRWTATTN